MFPLLTVPAYQNLILDENMSVDNVEVVFYATVASILSGAVFGYHVSVISESTVLSALASDCNLLSQFWTQIPYAKVAAKFCYFAPYPTPSQLCVHFILGAIVSVALVFLYAKQIVKKKGSFDLLVTAWMLLLGPSAYY